MQAAGFSQAGATSGRSAICKSRRRSCGRRRRDRDREDEDSEVSEETLIDIAIHMCTARRPNSAMVCEICEGERTQSLCRARAIDGRPSTLPDAKVTRHTRPASTAVKECLHQGSPSPPSGRRSGRRRSGRRRRAEGRELGIERVDAAVVQCHVGVAGRHPPSSLAWCKQHSIT